MLLKTLLVLSSIVAGIAVACQSAVNAGLSLRVGLGMALVVNTSVVLVGAIAFLVAGGGPTAGFTSGAPWYLYLGGLGGFIFILVNAFVFPRIGAGPAVALVVLGQGIAALAIDHYGLLGIPRHAVTPAQMVGFALIVAGVAFLKR